MEWARAKTIIIILFIVFNAFLLTRIIAESGGQGISREAVANMEKLLADRGIVVEPKVPAYDSDTPKLIFGDELFVTSGLVEKLLGLKPGTASVYDGEDRVYENGSKKLTVTGPYSFIYSDAEPGASGSSEKPGSAVNLNDQDGTEKYLKEFLRDMGLYNSEYVPDGPPERKDGRAVFTYLEKFKGYFVYDNYIKASVTEKGISGLEVRHRQVRGLTPDKVKDISNAWQILLEHFDGSVRTVVNSIDLGYKDVGYQDEDYQESAEQLPVWRIRVNGEERFFGASDGKEIK